MAEVVFRLLGAAQNVNPFLLYNQSDVSGEVFLEAAHTTGRHSG